MYRFGFIGAGNMATAILGGILHSGILAPSAICATDLSEEKRRSFAEKGITPLENAAQVTAQSQFILLAVKPQNIETVLTQSASVFSPDKVIVSIAAGISTSPAAENSFFTKSNSSALTFSPRLMATAP